MRCYLCHSTMSKQAVVTDPNSSTEEDSSALGDFVCSFFASAFFLEVFFYSL